MLATASREDLLAVKNHELYRAQTEDFVNAIEQAFSSAKLGKTRLGVTGPKVEAVKRIFRDDIRCILVPEAVIGIIGSYMTEDYENAKTEQRSDDGEESAPEMGQRHERDRARRHERDREQEQRERRKQKRHERIEERRQARRNERRSGWTSSRGIFDDEYYVV